MIFISILFLIITLFPPKQKILYETFYWVFGLFLILLAGFRDGDSVNDYSNYLIWFNEIKEGIYHGKEFGSILLVSLCRTSISMFFVYALLGVSFKLLGIRQLSNLWLLSLFTYFSYYFILHEMTQIRAGVASGLILLCIKPIYDRDWKRFLFFAIMASLFHYSALIVFPLWFLSHHIHKKMLALSIPISFLIYFIGLDLILNIPITVVQEKMTLYKSLQASGSKEWNNINVFNLVFLVKIAVFYLLLWKYDLIEANNKYVPIIMKVYCLSICALPLFAAMPVVSFRISELYGIVEVVLLPFIVYIVKPKQLGRGVVTLIGFVILLITIFYNNLIH